MKTLDLFSGFGGFSLGLERAGFETIAFCEIEEYPRKVLAKHWPDVPISEDVRNLSYKNGVLYDGERELYTGPIDVICGGFPCQDISVSGKQEGINAERSGLWSECARLLGEIRPDYAIFENVTNLLSGEQGRWMQRVLWDISAQRYDAEWHCVPASELGAHHHRDRIWIIANPSDLSHGQQSCDEEEGRDHVLKNHDVANAHKVRPQGIWEVGQAKRQARLRDRERQDKEQRILPHTDSISESISDDGSKLEGSKKTSPEKSESPSSRSESQGVFSDTDSKRGCGWSTWEQDAEDVRQSYWGKGYFRRRMEIWDAEPDVGRVANGIPNRVERLKGLGNAVVPQIPELIGKAIMETRNG